MAKKKQSPIPKAKILIAEDSPTQAKLLRHILEQHGYEVAVTTNGRQALESLPKFKPALIISDIIMPEMDGYELCKAVKSSNRWKDIPITLVTTLSDSQDVIRGLECGADNFIRKPYKARQLLERINYSLLNMELRKTQKMQIGIEIELGGHKHYITSERQQILDILISTYEEAVEIKHELETREAELNTNNHALQVLYSIAEGLNGVVGERDVAAIALQRVLELPEIEAGWISVREGDTGFRLVAAANLPPALEREVAQQGSCECRRRFLAGDLTQAINIMDCEQLNGHLGPKYPLRHHASVPLWLPNGGALGLMNLSKAGDGVFKEHELAMLLAVGHQVAVALERAQLTEGLEHLVETRTVTLLAESAKRQQAESELRRLNEALESKVEARTGELSRALETLKVNESRLQTILNSALDAVISMDDAGRVLDWNHQAERTFGYSRDEAIGNRLSDLIIPPASREAHQRGLARFLATGVGPVLGKRIEVAGLRAGGEEFPLELSIVAIPKRDGHFFNAFLRDITERKEAEQMITAARDEAKLANQAKSAFLAAMSHEIRTPMNGVIGMIDVLHQTSLKGHQVEMVNLIQESAYSLLGIIDDILDFSKIEAGKLEIERSPILLEDLLEKTCGMMDRLADKKSVDLTLFMDPTLPKSVLGDELRLRQILVNLVNNAIKFSSGLPRAGRVAVRASLAGQGQDVVTVVLQVADNGIGMDEATRAELFNPFTQADASTTRRFGGTGLGLAISRQLVALMGGEIEVQSAPDQGSTFAVRLPLEVLPPVGGPCNGVSPVEGLSCVVAGGPEGQAADWATYLEAGGARVATIPDLGAALEDLEALSPGEWIWILDNGPEPPSLDRLRAQLSSRPDLHNAFVVVGRGPQCRRRRPRREGDDRVLVDGNLLTRRTLFAAVALAAGRGTNLEEAEFPPPRETATPPPSHEEAIAQGRLILLAEDNETNQQVILKQLALLGFAADVVSDGAEALDRWRSGDYALLLTDLHMPKMDGYALASAIRAEEGESGRHPIIVLTANALKGEADRCRAAGMDDYLTKPMPLGDLKAMLGRWLPVAEVGLDDPEPVATRGRLPVDVSVLKSLVGSDPAVIEDFLQDFRIGATRIATEIGVACQGGQTEQAGALAHKLKSSARSVGAMRLGELCAELEQAGNAGDREVLNSLWPRFEAEMTAVDEFIRAL